MRGRGFTIIELLVAIVLATLILPLSFNIWKHLRRGSDQVTEQARYYQAVGRFLATFKPDVRVARRIRREGDGLVLSLDTEEFGRTREVCYTIDQERHRITRTEDGHVSVFDFGAPPPGAGTFVFRIE
ncbi:MAG: type II secretion system protein [Candidatus Riflebacteria bacterium]|nr:type II secretion system protein [Candidatus Riflebacteria bacterium]